MLVTLGGRAAQADEVLADHARRDAGQLHPLPLAPAQEPPHRPLIRPLRVRIVMLGVEEFLPGEAGRPPARSTSTGRPGPPPAGTPTADTLTSPVLMAHRFARSISSTSSRDSLTVGYMSSSKSPLSRPSRFTTLSITLPILAAGYQSRVTGSIRMVNVRSVGCISL